MENFEEFGVYPESGYEIEGIPKRTSKNFLTYDIEFTCIDAVDDVLVIGSNVGIVFFYQRKYNRIEKLMPEKMPSKVTCVKAVSSVDYLIAAGNEHGIITIYIIKKDRWSNNTEDNSIEQFTLDGIHFASISAVEWSSNAQKLFTGDQKGVVVCTKIDYKFKANVITPFVLLNENRPIVQLSYFQPQILLVSTPQRVFIYNQAEKLESDEYRIVELKKRDGIFGAVIYKDSTSKPKIYAALQDNNIWSGKTDGTILKNISFEDMLLQKHRVIELDEFPAPIFSKDKIPQFEFGTLKMYRKRLLAYQRNILLLFNLENSSIEVVAHCTQCYIISVAVSANEIFVLLNNRQIKRLAFGEDTYDGARPIYANLQESTLLRELGSGILDKVSQVNTKIVTKPLLKVYTIVENTSIDVITKMMTPVSIADEALVLLNYSPSDRQDWSEGNDGNKIQIIRSSGKKPNEAKIRDIDDDLGEIPFPFLHQTHFPEESVKMEGMNESSNGLTKSPLETEKDSTQEPPTEILGQIVSIPKKTDSNENVKENEDGKNVNDLVSNATVHQSPALDIDQPSTSGVVFNQNLARSPCSFEEFISPMDLMKNQDENLSANPIFLAFHEEEISKRTNEVECESDLSFEIEDENRRDPWKSCDLINPARWILATNYGIYYGASESSVYYGETGSLKLNWIKKNMKALRLFSSPSGNILWKNDLGMAYAHTEDREDPWRLIAKDVKSIAITNDSAWYVSEGGIYHHSGLTAERPFSNEPLQVEGLEGIKKICCFGDNVWLLTNNNEILSGNASGIGSVSDIQWRNVDIPNGIVVIDINLGCKNTGWIVSQKNEILFSDNFHNSDNLSWWQIFFDGSVFETSGRGTYSVSTSDNAVLISKTHSDVLLLNQNRIKGHRWIQYNEKNRCLSMKWRFVSAVGSSINSTLLWCLSQSNDLFVFNPSTEYYRAVEVPSNENIIYLATAPGSVWVLTESGINYCRKGIKDGIPCGVKWVQSNLVDKYGRQLQFESMLMGNQSVCAVDVHNKVFIASVNPLSIDEKRIIVDWVNVGNMPFSKVFMGPECGTVWAIDLKNQVFVRERITKTVVYGQKWIPVKGIFASHLAISMTDVWALDLQGTLYCRSNVTDENYIGDDWVKLLDSMSSITATKNEGLWGVSKDNKLMKYEKHIVSLLSDGERIRRISENIGGDWEFL